MTKPGNSAEPNEGPVAGDMLPPGERYGDYEVVKPLTSGGMADIFLARKLGVQGFQKLVVVKRIRRELVKDDSLVDMFIDEAHVAAKLDHPNVVSVSDLGEVDDSYFMAMEYLRGQTLRSVEKRITDQGKMLPPPFWARIMEYALDGLHYAHELRNDNGGLLGLVHRDFTPSNIMITYTGTVKVIDFGVAHVEGPTRHETRIGTIKGKIAYMSPEQCRGTQVVDRRTDVFAAGIVLWELLSRRQLFDGPSDTAIIVEILQGQISPPGWSGQQIDWGLQDIVMKALHRDPAHRYQTAADMRDDLREYLRSKQEKIDASDIGAVMTQLFEPERSADERLANSGRIDTGSRSNPLPKSRDSSSKSSSSGARGSVSRTGGSARGQKLPDNIPAPQATPSGKGSRLAGIAIGVVATLALGGVGYWRFVLKSESASNLPPVQAPQPAQPKENPPQPKENPPTVAVQTPEPPLAPPTVKTPTPKTTSPSEGYGTLDFDTRPYTEVFIGKKKMGDTPMLGVKVPAGKVTLTLINEDAGIHETYTITVPKDGHVFKKLKL